MNLKLKYKFSTQRNQKSLEPKISSLNMAKIITRTTKVSTNLLINITAAQCFAQSTTITYAPAPSSNTFNVPTVGTCAIILLIGFLIFFALKSNKIKNNAPLFMVATLIGFSLIGAALLKTSETFANTNYSFSNPNGGTLTVLTPDMQYVGSSYYTPDIPNTSGIPQRIVRVVGSGCFITVDPANTTCTINSVISNGSNCRVALNSVCTSTVDQ